MQLTERQKWDIVRELVKKKNEEVRSVIFSAVGRGNDNLFRVCVSRIRDNFLASCGTNVEQVIQKSNKKAKSINWIEVLSTDDLTLYYDYQCRALTRLYGFVWGNSNKRFNQNNVLEVIDSIDANFYTEHDILDLTGVPKSKKGEDKELFFDLYQAKQYVLSKSMLNLHNKYSRTHGFSSQISADELASRFRTFASIGQNIFGVQGCIVELKKMLGEDRLISKQVNATKAGEQLAIFSTTYGQEFSDAVEDNTKKVEDYDNGEYDDELVGFDINGTPIVRRGDKLYNSLGQRVEDNIYITDNELEI